jgi:hypothetical protein
MNIPFLFSGKVQFEQSGNPLANVRIELLCDRPDSKWIGGTQTDAQGLFYIYLSRNTAEAIHTRQTAPFVNILKDETLIYSGEIADIVAPQFISIHTGF